MISLNWLIFNSIKTEALHPYQNTKTISPAVKMFTISQIKKELVKFPRCYCLWRNSGRWHLQTGYRRGFEKRLFTRLWDGGGELRNQQGKV